MANNAPSAQKEENGGNAAERIILIAALSQNGVIGVDNGLPWHLPDDFRHFVRSTRGKPLVMGRKTFLSIGKPLKNRTNIILTRSKTFHFPAGGILIANSVEESLNIARASQEEDQNDIMIGGGAEIYRLFLPVATHMLLTHVDVSLEGDTMFPQFPKEEWTITSKKGFPADPKHRYSFEIISYRRVDQ